MIRVAFLTPTLHVGGAEIWISTLARHFQHCQPAGVLVTSPWHHPHVMRRIAQMMPVELCAETTLLAKLGRMAASVTKHADVLIAWGEQRLPNIVLGQQQSRNVACPIIEVSHADGAWAEQTPLVQRSYLGATHLAAVSEAAKTAFPEEVRHNVRMIPNGIEVDRVTPRRPAENIRRAYNIPPNKRVVLFLGRFADVKRPQRLIRAMPHLDDWFAIFAGHGPEQSDLVKFIHAACPGSARVIPPVSHVGDLLQLADCLCLPSLCEGHPLTVNEAWLAGVPVVTTDFAFSREINERHGAMVSIVPQECTGEELAAAIEEAPNKTEEVLHARQVAWRHYTASAFAQRWEQYLFAVVGERDQAAIFGME